MLYILVVNISIGHLARNYSVTTSIEMSDEIRHDYSIQPVEVQRISKKAFIQSNQMAYQAPELS